ncbi:MAG TPA: YraN family protein [Rhodocyclaceae bacterium]|nr:YraN family protein [Rhodocyclaceae bacterium]
MNGAKIDAGREAEDLAGAHLSRHGLRIVARNVRYRDGEIDLVCEDRDTLVFVEVRLRRDERFGGSAASITPHKRARVIRAALRYLSSRPERPCRFDVVLIASIEPLKLEWIKDAFQVG